MTHTLLSADVLESIKTLELDPALIKSVVESEILEALMVGVRYNQSKAAKLYGVSRGTIRTELKSRFGTKYVGTKGE